ncbi:ring-h2 finger protein atl1 [Quercus suber]|uniref:RING-type E3 ubiquitin transferase n=1 Tax=Quercus suber TaxID=58331 RepID=A0AAW0KHH7_QUESU
MDTIALGSSNRLSGTFFTPLLISLAGIAASTFAIIAYHTIVRRYCLWGRRQQQEQEQLANGLRGQSTIGVDQKILDTIPILSYTTKKCELFLADQTECAVCLGDLEDEDKHEKEVSASTSSTKDVPMRSRSARQVDLKSWKLLMSFSQLKLSRGSTTANGILPY